LKEGEFKTLSVGYWSGESFCIVVLIDFSLETFHVFWMTN